MPFSNPEVEAGDKTEELQSLHYQPIWINSATINFSFISGASRCIFQLLYVHLHRISFYFRPHVDNCRWEDYHSHVSRSIQVHFRNYNCIAKYPGAFSQLQSQCKQRINTSMTSFQLNASRMIACILLLAGCPWESVQLPTNIEKKNSRTWKIFPFLNL